MEADSLSHEQERERLQCFAKGGAEFVTEHSGQDRKHIHSCAEDGEMKRSAVIVTFATHLKKRISPL